MATKDAVLVRGVNACSTPNLLLPRKDSSSRRIKSTASEAAWDATSANSTLLISSSLVQLVTGC